MGTYSAYAETRNTTSGCVSSSRSLITLEINKLDIGGTFTASNKTYDGNNSATVTGRSLVGVLATDVANVSLTGGTATFSDELVETGKTVTSSGMALGGTAAPNYNLTRVATTTADITKLDISGTFTVSNKTYDGNNSATVTGCSLVGVLAADAANVSLTGGTATFSDELVEPGKTVTSSGMALSGTAAPNYNLTGVATTTADITKLDISGTFTASNKTYDGNNSATVTGRSLVGVLAADVANVSLAGGTATFSDELVGNFKVVTSLGMALSGTATPNYNLIGVATTTADITKLDISGTFTASNKTYDGNNSATVTDRSLVGVLAADVANVSLTGGAATFSNELVGNTKVVTSSGMTLSGIAAPNYNLTDVATTTADITKAMLTVTADTKTKIYGDVNPSLTFQYSGWKNSETDAVLDTKPTASTTVDLLTLVGTYTNTITVSGGVDNNYDFTYVPANFTVTQAMLTVTAEAKTKVYGEANPALTFLYSGWKNSENETVLDTKPTASTTVDLLTPVGTYTNTITVSGGMDNNYDFTYVPANFTVTQAMLIVTADAQTKVYGETNPALTFLYSGWKNSENETVLDTKPTASTTVDLLTLVGTYTNTITVSGGVDNNYDFTYVPANFTVTQAMLTVTAEAKTKVYGEANPDLTFLYSGWKNSENETVLDTKPTVSTTVDLLTPVGTYTNTITVSGGVDNNYDFTYMPANFTVTQAMLIVTAEAKTKVYGEANPDLTFLYNGWKNSEDETVLDTKPTVGTSVDLLTPVGTHTHTITASGGMDNNYDFTYVPADFEVTKVLITIDAEAQNKVYDGTTSASVTGAKLVGVLNGDVVSLILGSASFDNKNVGNDKVVTVTGSSISGAGAGNYTLKEISGLKANITPKQLTITNTSVVSNKMFDNATTAIVENVGILQGLAFVDANSVDISAIANYNDAAIGKDKVITTVFTIDGSAASNYIKPADLIITGAKISDKVNLAETMEVPVTGECQGEDLSVGYNILSGTPTEYRITFNASALAAGFVNTDYLTLPSSQNQDRLYIHVPANMVEGVYTANLQFRNELNDESPVYPFEFTIKLSKDYIVKKFDDVILCDNSSNRFTAFQWYKNGLPISGATGQFYNEESGLNGLYSLQVSTKEGTVLWSCEQEIHATNFKNATISAYPNPARNSEPFTVKVTNLNDQDLRGAVMRIYNVLGALVQTINEVKQINSVKLPFGEYIGTVITSDQKRFTYKITVVNL